MPQGGAGAGGTVVGGEVGVDVVHGGLDAVEKIADLVETGRGEQNLTLTECMGGGEAARLIGALAVTGPAVPPPAAGTGCVDEPPPAPTAPILA